MNCASFRVLFALSFVFSIHSVLAGSPAELKWEKMNDDDGIVTYAREVPGTSVLAMKGEGNVDAPLDRVASAIFDTEHAQEWVSDLEKAVVLRWNSPTEYVEYDHIGTPFVMKDREFVTKVSMNYDRSAGVFTYVMNSVDDPKAPKTSYIRGILRDTKFVLTSIDGGKRTHVMGEVWCDPAGSVAKWIVNLFQKSWAVDTLSGLRKQVAKRGFYVHPKLKEIIAAAPKEQR